MTTIETTKIETSIPVCRRLCFASVLFRTFCAFTTLLSLKSKPEMDLIPDSTGYYPHNHENGESAHNPGNRGNFFKHVHLGFLFSVYDFDRRCRAAPLLNTAANQPTFFVNRTQVPHFRGEAD